MATSITLAAPRPAWIINKKATFNYIPVEATYSEVFAVDEGSGLYSVFTMKLYRGAALLDSKAVSVSMPSSSNNSGTFVYNWNIDALTLTLTNEENLTVTITVGTATSSSVSITVKPIYLDFNGHATNLSAVTYNAFMNLPAISTGIPSGYTSSQWISNGVNFNPSAFFKPSDYSSWFTDSYIADFDAVLTKITYYITVVQDGGSGGAVDNTSYQISSSTQLKTMTVPTKTGYVFAGWVITSGPSGGSITILSNTSIRINANTYGNFTITAQWTFAYEDVTYTIFNGAFVNLGFSTYNASSGAQTLISVTADARSGYILNTFIIDRATGSGGPTPYISGGNIVIPTLSYGDFTVAADYTAIDYDITYHVQGGIGAHGNPLTYRISTTTFNLVQGSMIKTGYTFLGWFDAASGGNQVTQVVQGSSSYLSVYAQWTIVQYNITYTLNGSTAFPVSGVPDVNPETYNVLDALITFVTSDFSRPGWTPSTFAPATIPAGSTEDKSTSLGWNAETYAIGLNNNGGSGLAINIDSYNSSDVNGQAIQRTLTPSTRSGYTFSSYTLTRTGTYGGATPTISGNTLTIPSGSYGDMTINAVYIGNTNPITFTGAIITGQNWTTVASDTEKTFTIPTKTGYKLPTSTISTQSQGGNSLVTNIDYAGAIGIPANAYGSLAIAIGYTAIGYTIAFNSNGGSTVTSKSATYDVAIGALTSPTKTGYAFGGWYKEQAFTNLVTSASINLTSTDATTVTLYAKWTANVLTIQYDIGTGTSGTMTNSTGNYDGTVLVKANGFTKTGWTFSGWLSDDALANTTEPVANINYNVNDLSSLIDDGNDTIKLTAQYTINQYVVSFIPNGGTTVNDIIQNYNTSVVKPSDPTRIGYSFVNWYTDAALTNVQTWPFNMPIDGKILYAKWNVNQYTISFQENGGSLVNDITQNYSTVVAQPANPTRVEYNFNGWYSDVDLTIAYVFGNMPAYNTTAYAKWSANQYTLKFVDWDGTVLQTGDYDYESNTSGITPPANPSRTGYAFVGWSASVPATMPANNVTITATYDINQYTVAFEGDGGQTADITQNYNTSVIKPTNPVQTGYTFINWYLEVGLTTVQSWPFNMPVSGKTLYAKFTINQYTISFTVNGGTAVTAITRDYNSAVIAPTPPTKAGYTFSGWFSDAILTVPYVFGTMPASNITLYAKWTINQYTISFIENGGSLVDDIVQNYNTTVVEPSQPTKEGNYFGGWFSDAAFTQVYAFTTIPANDVIVYVKWTVGEYTLQFLDYEGTVLQTGDYDFGADLSGTSAPADPTRTGWTFVQWSGSIPATMPAGNVTIIATYDINQYKVTYEENGGTTATDLDANYGTTITLPTITKLGYTFIGWFSNIGLTTAYTYTAIPAMDTTAYAKWQINQYTIDLVTNVGSPISQITQDYNTDVTIPVTTRPGWTFSGWFTNAQLTTAYALTKIPAYNQTLYAKWVGIPYDVTLVLNGGTGDTNKTFTTSESQQTRTLKIGADMTKTVINKKHLFSHWEMTTNTSGVVSIIAGATLTIPANAYGAITLTARWNVAARAVYVGSKRLEDNKLKIGVTAASVKVTAINTKNVYEKDLYLEE